MTANILYWVNILTQRMDEGVDMQTPLETAKL